MSEVHNMSNFLYIILPNGKKRRYKKPDMTRVNRATADYIYNAIETRKRPDKAIEEVKKEIAEEDAHVRALVEKGVRI